MKIDLSELVFAVKCAAGCLSLVIILATCFIVSAISSALADLREIRVSIADKKE